MFMLHKHPFETFMKSSMQNTSFFIRLFSDNLVQLNMRKLLETKKKWEIHALKVHIPVALEINVPGFFSIMFQISAF